MDDVEVFAEGEYGDDEPLVPAGCAHGDEVVVWDERGVLRPPLREPLPARGFPIRPERPELRPPPVRRPCPVAALNGSWYLRFVGGLQPLVQLRGPLRIEAREPVLRVSGDLYRYQLRFSVPGAFPPRGLRPPAVGGGLKLPPGSLVVRRNWYPQLPRREYVWYLRSTGASYANGVLEVPFERHLWSHAQQAFTSSDAGWLRLSCHRDLIRAPSLPQPTIRMTGEAMVGGHTYPIEATKTAPYYRGCLVEVDVMQNRAWPASAAHGGSTVTFTGVFRSQGLDFRAQVSDGDVPENANLSIADLHDLLEAHRNLTAGRHGWHLWLLVGSRLGTGGTYGIMFDQIEPHREGAVGFADPTLPNLAIIEESVRGSALGNVDSAFLRTLIHEAGHAFNLYHPKHDVHDPPVGVTIMNQTGDVMGFASAADPYPGNAEFAFHDHNATSLVHAPDPQIAPGWKPFGWGHGNLWGGAADPVDVAGLAEPPATDSGLQLELTLPPRAGRGEILVAEVVLTNTSATTRTVSAALNLAEDDMRIVVEDPRGDVIELRDIVVACAPRRLFDLEPGQSLRGALQLFYTNRGFAFDQPGMYRVCAELDVGDGTGDVVKSSACEVEIDLPVDDAEREIAELTMDREVGLAVALGDVTVHERAEQRLTELMDRFIDRDTGAVSALVLANSLSRPARDLSTGDVLRDANGNRARGALDRVLRDRSAVDVARLALATVSPIERDAPVLDAVVQRLRRAPRGTYKKAEVEAAEHLLDALRA